QLVAMLPEPNANAAHAIDVVRDVRDAVLQTAALSTILDREWFDNVEQEIAAGGNFDALEGDQSGFVFDFAHILRGAPWFEDAQRRILDGHGDEVDPATLEAVGFAGLDHLKTVVPKLDSRLAAFSQLQVKQHVVRTKLAQLRR